MIRTIALTLALCLLPMAAGVADVYRWVDDNGRTHYGETVPKKYKQSAKKVGVEDAMSPTQRREAEDRAARDKANLEALQKAREARVQSEPQADEPKPPATAQGNDCQEQMRKYQESQDCFAPFRLAKGGIRPEAFEKCQSVTQPVGCLPSGSGPSNRTYMEPPP